MATISNETIDSIIIAGSDDADIIKNAGKNVTIISGAGNDTISNSGDSVTISADDGNDIVSNSGSTVMVDGGAGDDIFSIDAQSKSPTITTGEGSDTISFVYPDSSEQTSIGVVITDLSTEDALSFSPNIDSTSITAEYSKRGLILTDDKNHFSATLSGITSTKDISDVTIYTPTASTSLGDLLTNEVNVKSAKRVVKDFVSSLNGTSETGTTAIDSAVVFASDGRFTGYKDLVTAFINDYINATDKNNFFKNYCGIDLTNDDVGAITGYDAGSSANQISAVDIVPENQAKFVSLDEIYTANSNSFGTAVSDATITSGAMSFTKKGLTIKVADFESLVSQSKGTSGTSADSAKNKLSIINGLYSWWIENSIDLINNSFGVSFTTEGATSTELKLSFFEDTSDTAAYVSLSGSDLKINSAKVKDLNLSDSANGGSSGLLEGNYYLDRLIAHELTHAVLSANVTDLKSYTNDISNNKYKYWAIIVEGLAELTQGADDTRKDDLNKLLANFTKENVVVSDVISAVVTNSKKSNSSALQTMFSDVENVEYVFGYALLRYFAKQVEESSIIFPEGVRYADIGNKDNTAVVTSLYSGASFNLSDYSSTIKNLNVSSVKNEKYQIIGNDADNVITALPAGGSIYGGAGSDTLYGGDGVDYFFYADGADNDVIYDFTSDDFLKIAEGKVVSVYADQNNDVTVKLEKGTVVLKGVAETEISIIDADGHTTKDTYTVETPEEDTTEGGEVSDNKTLKCINGYYEYTGDHKIIADYVPGERIRYSTDFKGFLLGDNNISVQSSTGELCIEKSAGEVMEFIYDENGRLIYAYRATGGENVDGSEFSAFEVIMGATNNANYIAAGSGGSSLWGGGGTGENTLVGGAGGDKFIFTGGIDVIQNFGTGDKVKIYPGNWSEIVSGDNLTVTNDEGSITLQNVRNKIIELVDGNENLVLTAYYAGNGGVTDGRSVAGSQYIVGTTDLSDNIYIGSSGGSTLTGNIGVDTFFWGKGDGSDLINNAAQNDFLNLYNVPIDEISQAVEVVDNLLSIDLKSGQNLMVQCENDLSPIINLTDSTWQYSTVTDWVKLD